MNKIGFIIFACMISLITSAKEYPTDPAKILAIYLKQHDIDVNNSKFDDVKRLIETGVHNAEWRVETLADCSSALTSECKVIRTHIEILENCLSFQSCKIQKGNLYIPNNDGFSKELGRSVVEGYVYVGFYFNNKNSLVRIALEYDFSVVN